MYSKSIFKSKTFWIAVAQAIGGIALVFNTAYPQFGGLLLAKSLIDIAVRFLTTQPIDL